MVKVTRLLGEVEQRDVEMTKAAAASETAMQASLEDYEEQRMRDSLEIEEHLGEVNARPNLLPSLPSEHGSC